MKIPVTDKNFELKITIHAGDLKIYGEDRLDLEVMTEDFNNISDYYDIKISENKLELKNKGQKMGLFKNNNPKIDKCVIIKVPKEIILTGAITLYSGDLDASFISYDGEMTLFSGDVHLDNFYALENSKIDLFSGDIIINKGKGYINGAFKSGDIKIEEYEFNAIKIKSLAGDVKISGKFYLNEDGYINCLAGNVQLNILEKKDNLMIVSNNFMNKFKNISLNEDNKDVEGELITKENDKNKIYLRIKSLAGNLKVTGSEVLNANKSNKMYFQKENQSNHKANFSLVELLNLFKENFLNIIKENSNNAKYEYKKSDKEKDEAVNKILDMLENGKITAEEANKLLKSL